MTNYTLRSRSNARQRYLAANIKSKTSLSLSLKRKRKQISKVVTNLLFKKKQKNVTKIIKKRVVIDESNIIIQLKQGVNQPNLIIHPLEALRQTFGIKSLNKADDWKILMSTPNKKVKVPTTTPGNESLWKQYQTLMKTHCLHYWPKCTIEYVANQKLCQRFHATHQQLGPDFRWIVGFHGTSEHNLKSICSNGFYLPGHKSYLQATGQAYGSGAYFGSTPTYCIWKPSLSDSQCTTLIVCLLLVGRSYGNQDIISAGSTLMNGYDSHCSSNSSFYVIFDSTRILPLFLISGNTLDIKRI